MCEKIALAEEETQENAPTPTGETGELFEVDAVYPPAALSERVKFLKKAAGCQRVYPWIASKAVLEVGVLTAVDHVHLYACIIVPN